MPTSSEAVSGEYQPIYVSEQNYNRLEREDPTPSPKEIKQNPDDIPNIPSTLKSSHLKIALIVAAISIFVIAAAVIPAVVLTQVVFKSTSSSDSTTTIQSNTLSSSNTGTTVSISVTSTSAGASSSSSSSSSVVSSSTSQSASTTSSCGTFVCNLATAYTLIASGYHGTELVNISCTHSLSNFTGRIYVQRTVGAAFSSQHNTFWGGVLNQYNSSTSSEVIYAWDINPGQTVVVTGFPLYIEGQFQLNGINQTVANDRYTIIAQSACSGQVLTYNGNF